MEFTVYSLSLAISIVILSSAVCAVAIIRAKQKSGNPSFMAGLNDLKEAKDMSYVLPMSKSEMRANRTKGSLNALIPGIQEAAGKRRSYREALLVEQLMSRLSTAKSEYSKSNSLFKELKEASRTPRYKIDIAYEELENARGIYLHAVASAAWWHFQGYISLELYKQFFLKNAVDVYENVECAACYTNIEKAVTEYRELIEHRNNIPEEE